MAALNDLLTALCEKSVRVVDLTAPLSPNTPIIRLPEDHGQPSPLRQHLISRYDEKGADVYWNNLELSEHTGTHFDAPIHWISGQHLEDVAQVSPERLIRPAAVLDFSAEAAADPDFLLTRAHVERWQRDHGPLPDGGWLLYRTGWDERVADAVAFLNDSHTPGVAPECAAWLAHETPIIGIGVETVGTDAGLAATFTDHPFPCHWYFHGAGKYGLSQLQNLALLPDLGAVIVAAPLRLIGGSGSPCRVLALVEERQLGGHDRAVGPACQPNGEETDHG